MIYFYKKFEMFYYSIHGLDKKLIFFYKFIKLI